MGIVSSVFAFSMLYKFFVISSINMIVSIDNIVRRMFVSFFFDNVGFNFRYVMKSCNATKTMVNVIGVRVV